MTYNAGCKDVCIRNGTCAGRNLCKGITCKEDQCHPAPAKCDKGKCPQHKAGTACNDTVATTENDACDANGICKGTDICNRITCPKVNEECQLADGCFGGKCRIKNEADGTPCDDRDITTTDDACKSGECVGRDRCDDIQCDTTEYVILLFRGGAVACRASFVPYSSIVYHAMVNATVDVTALEPAS